MRNYIFRSVFLLVTLLSIISLSNKSLATHIAGGYIQLECTGTPGVYTLRLILYYDCSAPVNAPNNANINFTNNCAGVSNQNFNVSQVGVQEVSQICPQELPNSTCNGGNLQGFEEYTYEATINLDECDTWDASYSICCRNSVENIPDGPFNYGPEFEVTSQFNTQTDNCNTTPIVTAQPEPYVCVNQPVSYNLGASEPNGNTITYQLVDALAMVIL